MKICLNRDCDRKHYARGYCRLHYDRLRKTGSVDLKIKRSCAVEKCDRPSSAHGWCDMHYQRWKRTGDPTKVTRVQVKELSPMGTDVYGEMVRQLQNIV